MSLRSNHTAPDLGARTTRGPLGFRARLGDSWPLPCIRPVRQPSDS